MNKILLIFAKMHGLGNDYIVVDESEREIIPEVKKPEVVRELCRRGFSVGADGMIFVSPTTLEEADIRFRIFNSDGSEAEMCGNGIRCFAKFVYENELVPQEEMIVETLGGIKELQVEVNEGEVISTRVDMGSPIFKTSDIPMISEDEEFLDREIIVGGKPVKMTVLSIGNPHAVIFTDNLESVSLKEIGPIIENHPSFPQKINVHYVKVINENEIEMKTWERGAGITLACGTGATSCAIAGYKLGKLDETVEVHLTGGDLFIIVYNMGGGLRAFMEGDAVLVFEGMIEIQV